MGWAFVGVYRRQPLKIIGLDIHEPYLKKLATMSKMYELVKVDLETEPLPLPDESVDVAIAIEVIEHLSKSAGYMLVREMERVTRKGGFVYLTTPNGFARTDERPNHLTHKSGWTVQELKKLGFEVRGYGFPLRKRTGKISRIVSNVDFAWTSLSRIFPGVSYGLEAWKKR